MYGFLIENQGEQSLLNRELNLKTLLYKKPQSYLRLVFTEDIIQLCLLVLKAQDRVLRTQSVA